MWEFYHLYRGVTWLDMSLLTGVYLNLYWNLLPFNLLKASFGLRNLLHWPCDVFDHMTVIIELVIKEKSFFEDCEMIISAGAWSNPTKPEPRPKLTPTNIEKKDSLLLISIKFSLIVWLNILILTFSCDYHFCLFCKHRLFPNNLSYAFIKLYIKNRFVLFSKTNTPKNVNIR